FLAWERPGTNARQVALHRLGVIREPRAGELGGHGFGIGEGTDRDHEFAARLRLHRRTWRRLRGERRRVTFARDAHAHRGRRIARLRIEHHGKHDYGEKDEGNRPYQASSPAALQRFDVLLFLSHAITSPTVRKDPNTTILSFSSAASSAAAKASAREANLCAPGRYAASSSAVAPRGPASEARCQRVTRGFISRSTPAMSLSRRMPHTAIVSGQKPLAAR